MAKLQKILITIDLEEFDLPLEYNVAISKVQQIQISKMGLENLMTILNERNIKATFFTTAFYAENNPEQILKLASEGHEIASHMYYHSDYNNDHILSSKLKLEEISKTKINGIRIPRLKEIDKQLIKNAGYIYDSSMNPTFIPGKYNNLSKSKTMYVDTNTHLIILPVSVSIFRIPLFWLSFKHFYLPFYIFLSKFTLKRDGYLHLYFHPWEFADLSTFNIPNLIKKNSGEVMLSKLSKLLDVFKNGYQFQKISDFLNDK